jgi:hypothetical protein
MGKLLAMPVLRPSRPPPNEPATVIPFAPAWVRRLPDPRVRHLMAELFGVPYSSRRIEPPCDCPCYDTDDPPPEAA